MISWSTLVVIIKGLESALTSPLHPPHPTPKPCQQQLGLSLCCISPLSFPPPSSCSLLISPLSKSLDAAGMSSLQHLGFEPLEALTTTALPCQEGSPATDTGERGEPPFNSLMLSAAEKGKGEEKK
ncbi:uncharacterized [Tachysurus ichikawai]